MSRRISAARLLAIPGLLCSRSGWTPSFLLRDDFTTDDAAPLTSPRTAEPGPGTLTVTDTNTKLSVSGGALSFATGAAVSDGVWGALRTRLTGRAMLVSVTPANTTGAIRLGWDDNTSDAIHDSVFLDQNGAIGIVAAGGTAFLIGVYAATTYRIAAVMRSSGIGYYIKGGAFTEWTLLWLTIANNASAYAALQARTTATIFTADTLRVLDLPSPFNSDYVLATQRISGSVSAGQTFTHEADCLIEWTQTTMPSASDLDLRFRRQDATNYWQVTVSSTGALTLNEVVAGTPTSRGASAGVIANGDRIVIIASGTTIRVYEANTLRITYASASNFATATAGELVALGTSGAVSDLIAWPRTLSGNAATILDLAVA